MCPNIDGRSHRMFYLLGVALPPSYLYCMPLPQRNPDFLLPIADLDSSTWVLANVDIPFYQKDIGCIICVVLNKMRNYIFQDR